MGSQTELIASESEFRALSLPWSIIQAFAAFLAAFRAHDEKHPGGVRFKPRLSPLKGKPTPASAFDTVRNL